jgi:threonylcarbamoyladenosine tRNA methylthiotransferase MtaB
VSVHVITMGCRLNGYESAVMKENAEKNGETDTVIINSCAVTAEAVRQTRQTVRKAGRDFPNSKIVLTGCAAQIDPQSFAKMPEIHKIIGNHEKLAPDMLKSAFSVEDTEKVKVNDIFSVKETAGHMAPAEFSSQTRAYLQIQNGCDHRCTFCIIPYGRGNSRSVPAGSVIEQVKRLTDKGAKEIVLTGVDLTAWGADLPGAPKLGDLVAQIFRLVPDLPRLRLSSVDSPEVDPALFEQITAEPRFAPYLHLSLQSGDNMILKRMKRRHNREQVIALTAALREKRSEMAFGADIIAGFPTETEEMFANSKKIIREIGIAYAHIFPFSPREGTPAAKMPQLSGSVIKRRAAELRGEATAFAHEFLESRIGKPLQILTERDGSGRTGNFMKIIVNQPITAGQLITVRPVSREGEALRADII